MKDIAELTLNGKILLLPGKLGIFQQGENSVRAGYCISIL